MEKKLVIIDGSSLLYRAFYALPPTMTSPDGIPTNAVYGFLRMLLGLYRDLDPEYMAVTFDKDRHTFRTEMYEDTRPRESRHRMSWCRSLTSSAT